MWQAFRIQRPQLILAVMSGLLLTAAFPKIDQGWLAWTALVPFFLAVRKADLRQGFAIGFAGGLVHHLGLIYWTVHTMNVYGGLPLVTAVVLMALLACYMSLYTGLFTMALTLLRARPRQLLWMAPAVWTALEMIRAHLFTGFPWELLGYSQYDALWVLQSADLFGPYGISALIVAVNACISLALLHWLEEPWQGEVPGGKVIAVGGALVGVVLAGVLAYGVVRMQAVDQAAAQAGERRRVTVVQGNIDQAVKWDPGFQVLTAVKYKNLSLSAAAAGSDLIIWPETATPFYFLRDELLSNLVLEGIKNARTWFLIGTPVIEEGGKGGQVSLNSAYLMTPRAEPAGRYDKVHLVPFGEYVPLKPLLPFVGNLVAQVGDFKSGQQGKTLAWENNPIGVQICYEIIFPELSRDMARNGARLLANITNDAWFGRTSAAYQHFSMAVFRAVENRRWLARSANTGISGFVDPSGRILAPTPLFEEAVVSAEVGLLTLFSGYTRWGDWPLGAAVFGVLSAFAARRFLPGRIGKGAARPFGS